MIQPCCEYLSVRCIWLYVFITSSTFFKWIQISTFYSCLNIEELLTRNRHDIWSLSDCNGIRTHYNLVPKGTLNNLAKLVNWLSCVVSTYLYSAFDCMFLSCHVRDSEWIHTCQNVKELLTRNRRHIWSLSDCNGSRT